MLRTFQLFYTESIQFKGPKNNIDSFFITFVGSVSVSWRLTHVSSTSRSCVYSNVLQHDDTQIKTHIYFPLKPARKQSIKSFLVSVSEMSPFAARCPYPLFKQRIYSLEGPVCSLSTLSLSFFFSSNVARRRSYTDSFRGKNLIACASGDVQGFTRNK